MDRFFIASIFCFLLFLAAGCQKQDPGTPERENLSDAQEAVVIPADDSRIASISVENAPARYSESFAKPYGVKVKEKEQDAIDCRLSLDKPEKTAKWYPIPIHFVSPNQPGKKFSASFAETLSFIEVATSPKKLVFVVKFAKDQFSWASLWKVTPYLSKQKDKNSCHARAEICPDYVEKDGEYSCRGNWRWLKGLVAVPDLVAYFKGQGEKLSGLKGIFYSQDQQGKVVTSEPEVLK